MEEQIAQLQRDVEELKFLVNKNKFSNLYVFDTPVKFRSGFDIKDVNVSTGSTTGSKIGATGDKIGFLGATPVARQADITAPSGGATIDSQARTAINSILSVLDAFGFTS